MRTDTVFRRTVVRFLSRVANEDRGHSTPCWIWQHATGSNGYGRFQIGWPGWPEYRESIAHRASYKLFVGKIPDDMTVDHVCRNRSCVNPEHLRLLSQKDNVLAGNTFASKNKAKTHCPSGHEYTTENTYLYRGSRNCVTCRQARKRKDSHVCIQEMR